MSISSQWREYTGQTEPEIQGYGWLDAIHPEDLDGTRAAFQHAFSSGEPIERRQRIRCFNKGYRWHLVRHTPIRDENGSIVEWFGSAVDIQDLSEAENKRGQLEAELLRLRSNPLSLFGSNASDAAQLVDHLLFARTLAEKVGVAALSQSIDLSLLLMCRNLRKE